MATTASWSSGKETPDLTLDALLDGSLRVVDLQRTETTFRAVVRGPRRVSEPLLSAREREVVRRLALGHCQKLVAFDFGLAHTTVSSHLRSALDKLGLPRWETVVLVAAAVEAASLPDCSEAERATVLGEQSTDEIFLLVRRTLAPDALSRLTEAERAVALLIVDGRTNAEIGAARNCSPRTVANQVSSLFRKLGVHGRCELIRRLVSGPSDVAPNSGAARRASTTHLAEPVALVGRATEVGETLQAVRTDQLSDVSA
jgi:DNA-binding NarL/FixJ family response regulator